MFKDTITHIVEGRKILEQYGQEALINLCTKMYVVQRELIVYKELSNILNEHVSVINIEEILFRYEKEFVHKTISETEDGFFFNDKPLVIFTIPPMDAWVIDNDGMCRIDINYEATMAHDVMTPEEVSIHFHHATKYSTVQ